MGPTMNLISGTHHLCERREYTFMVLREYTIISLVNVIRVQIFCLIFPTPSHTPPINICHMYTYLSKIIFNLSLFQFPNINQKLKNPNPPHSHHYYSPTTTITNNLCWRHQEEIRHRQLPASQPATTTGCQLPKMN